MAAGGKQRTDIRASLERLRQADFELEGYDAVAAQMGRLEGPTDRGRIRLVADLTWKRGDPDARHAVYLGPWLTKQLLAGHLTYLDWRVLRALDGLAKRLWVYLESQTFNPPCPSAFGARR